MGFKRREDEWVGRPVLDAAGASATFKAPSK
jgi:hypothetical protein